MFAGGKTQLSHDLAFNEEKLGFIVPCTSFQWHTVDEFIENKFVLRMCSIQTKIKVPVQSCEW
jgi:hypothetical protein